jgi:hypothetical protein
VNRQFPALVRFEARPRVPVVATAEWLLVMMAVAVVFSGRAVIIAVIRITQNRSRHKGSGRFGARFDRVAHPPQFNGTPHEGAFFDKPHPDAF